MAIKSRVDAREALMGRSPVKGCIIPDAAGTGRQSNLLPQRSIHCTSIAHMLDAVIDAVRQVAHDEILPRLRDAAGTRKADGTFLSGADLRAEHALVRSLRAIADVPVLGEEMDEAVQKKAWDAGAAGLWCVDPLDGTTNFLHGLPHFAVSVAYLVAGKTTVGVVYSPMHHEMFTATRGKGARLNGMRLIVPARATMLRDAVAAIEPKQLAPGLRLALATAPPYYSMRNWGSGALDWCYLAAGRFDIFLHGGQRLWDYAAGALILEEAGGALGMIEGEDFWAASPWHRSVVATSTPALFGSWVNWVRAASTDVLSDGAANG